MTTGVGIEIDVTAALKKIGLVGFRLALPGLLKAVGLRHINWSSENINRGGFLTRWARMSPNTIFVRPVRSSSHHFSSNFAARLKQSLTSRVGAVQVSVGTQQKFARFHHFGTDPKTFGPKNKAALRFQTAGGLVFAKSVRHPGLPARPLIPSKRVGKRLANEVLNAIARQLDNKAEPSVGGV